MWSIIWCSSVLYFDARTFSAIAIPTALEIPCPSGPVVVSTPGVTYRMFRALSDEKINILAISTSEIKLSVIIEEDNILKAIKKLHTVFELD